MDNIPAIYEGGVFKPLQPVSLPERTQVSVAIPETPPTEVSDDLATRRRAALQRLFDAIDNDPECRGTDDGWSVANNADEILYGGPKGPA